MGIWIANHRYRQLIITTNLKGCLSHFVDKSGKVIEKLQIVSWKDFKKFKTKERNGSNR
jgi:DNA-binding winged helix-turn-helix (wHTH) protein